MNYGILVHTHIHTQGCFTAIPLAFILPTASYLKLSKTKWCSRGKLVALAVLILGVIVMFIGTGLAIKKVSYGIILKTSVYCCGGTYIAGSIIIMFVKLAVSSLSLSFFFMYAN